MSSVDHKYLDSNGRAEYQIRVHIIEARDLKGRGRNGMSDPIVRVSIDGQKQYTKRFKNTTSAVFDHLMFFTCKWTPSTFDQKVISISVLDANTFRRNVLIGSYDLGAEFVYGEEDHEVWHRWLMLTDNEHHDGAQGYLKVSVVVLAPGDQAKTHTNVDIDDEDEDVDFGDLQSLVLRPPNLNLQGYDLRVFCYRAVELPKMDTFGKADPYVSVSFAANNDVRTKVIKKTLNPVWNEELRLPVYTPTLSNVISLSVYDWEKTGKDDLIASLFFRFTDIQIQGEIPPRWYNLYGKPKTKSISGTSVRKAAKLQILHRRKIEDPEQNSEYRGRILLALSAETNDNPVQTVLNTTVPNTPPSKSFSLYFGIYEAAEIKGNALEKMFCEIRIGTVKLRTKKKSMKGRRAVFYETIKRENLVFPQDPTQAPDVFVNFYVKSSVLGKARIGFVRYSFADVLNPRKVPQPVWESLTPDKHSPLYKPGKIPGFALFRIVVADSERFKKYKFPDLVPPKLKKYQIRCYVYQGRNLPAADNNGLSDPYLLLRIGKFKMKTKKILETLNPSWFEIKVAEIELPENIEYAPNLNVLAYDWDRASTDDLLGRCEISVPSMPKRFDGTPKWYPLYMDDKNVTHGEVLLGFQLVPVEEISKYPVPESIVPKFRKCFIDIGIVGLRQMLPYRMMSIKNPFILLDISGGNILDEDNVSNRKNRKYLEVRRSNEPSGTDPNHLQNFRVAVELPESHIFASSLDVRVFDSRMNTSPLVGSASIPLGPFIPWSDVKVKVDNLALPPIVTTIPGSRKEVEDSEDEDDEPEDLRDALISNLSKANEMFDELDLIEFETPKSQSGLRGLRTIPDVRDTVLGERDAQDNSDEDDSPVKGRPRVKFELEHEFKELPFLEYELKRGKVRGISAMQKMFKSKARKGSTERVVGRIKGSIKILEEDDGKYDPARLQKMFQETPVVVRVYVLRGMSLVPADDNGLSDPYIKIYKGNPNKKKNLVVNDRQNKIRKTLNPKFFKCYEFNATIPGNSDVHIQVYDWDKVGGDDLIGETVIDLENRYFSEEWKSMKQKPIEYRTLWTPTSSNPQGKLELWVDIMSPKEAENNPQVNIGPPVPEEWELRVVVWNTRNVPFLDKKMTDIYVTGTFDPGSSGSKKAKVIQQSTDVHWRSKDGNGAFNWRFVFPVTLPAKVPRVKFAIWDKDILSPNDSAGECVINLKSFFKKAYKTQNEQVISKQWVVLKHPNHGDEERGEIELELSLLPLAVAKSKPAGLGRKEPNQYPFLPKPVRPFESFAPWRLDKYFQIGWAKYKYRIYALLFCILCLFLLYVYNSVKVFIPFI